PISCTAIYARSLHDALPISKVGENELLRLVNKYGVDTVLAAFDEVQDYVERLTRAKIRELPNGTWNTVDYIDMDPELGDGLIPIDRKSTRLNSSHVSISYAV